MVNNEEVRYILEKKNFEVGKIIPVTTGLFHTSYIIHLKSPCQFKKKELEKIFLRIAPPHGEKTMFYEKDMIKKEPKILDLVESYTNIPVPGLIVFDNSLKIIDREFSILEYIEAVPLSEYFYSDKIQHDAIYQTGQYLSELHSTLRYSKFGYPGKNDFNSWQEAFFDMWSKLVEDIFSVGVYDKREKKF